MSICFPVCMFELNVACCSVPVRDILVITIAGLVMLGERVASHGGDDHIWMFQ